MRWLLCGLVVVSVAAAGSEPATPESEGRQLATRLCAQRPTQNLSTSGVLKVRDANGKAHAQILVHMQTVLADPTWETTYQATSTNGVPVETLTVIRSEDQPTRYHVVRFQGQSPTSVDLSGDQSFVPFAGTEFWLGDLGLEFFHWPLQRLVKKEMRKGRSCRVLECANPHPVGHAYARVLCWIDYETEGLLRAEAYDADRKLVKEFSVGSVKKVDGRYQLKSMEIRNEQTDARTRLEFDLQVQAQSAAQLTP